MKLVTFEYQERALLGILVDDMVMDSYNFV